MRTALVALGLACAACALFGPPPDDPARLAAWQRQTVSLRELEFRRDVAMRWVSRDEMAEVLREEAGAELAPARVTRERDSLAALGALDPKVDLGKELLALYASQVAGLYSMKRNTLFVSDDMSGPLQSLVLDPLVVHELVHALQDQNFPHTLELMSDVEGEDDLSSALSGAIEGDASVTMLAALPGADEKHDLRRVEVAEMMRDEHLKQLDDPSTEVGRAPRLIAAALVFPYAYGTVAAARRFQREGNAGLDAELLDPPLATLHLMYPESRGPVDFVRLPLESLRAAPETASCALGTPNVAGALVLRVLFEKSLSPEALPVLLRGWRGDRYAQLDCGGKWELVWLTRWSTPAAAQRFAAAYRELAPAIAARTPLSGPAEVVVRDTSALVVTPGLRAHADALLSQAEVRSFTNLDGWIASDCFPDGPCPKQGAGNAAAE